VEQLANEYELRIRKKGYNLDDIWEKYEQVHEGTMYSWHDDGFGKEERLGRSEPWKVIEEMHRTSAKVVRVRAGLIKEMDTGEMSKGKRRPELHIYTSDTSPLLLKIVFSNLNIQANGRIVASDDETVNFRLLVRDYIKFRDMYSRKHCFGQLSCETGQKVSETTRFSFAQNLVTFFPDFFVLQGLKTGNLIGAGDCRGGLYWMEGIKEERHAMMVTIDSWHKRLGHASNVKLSSVSFLKGVSLNFKDKVCDSCNKAKLTRLPFPVSCITTSNCFDLIHCDVWGKYKRPSLTGANYFLTIVDDYSRAVWVYMHKHKHESSTCLIDFCNIHCDDNGGEFMSNNMNQFYKEQRIILETTCPHTPQQNRVVERKHRHLLEIARALRFEASLPTTFWGGVHSNGDVHSEPVTI
nr:retrovirus-related Pol polyprotein from transposon TNT 1-94 [Tanacetum cinerariifolium]